MIGMTTNGALFKRPYLSKVHHTQSNSKLRRIRAINKPRPKSMDFKDYDANNNNNNNENNNEINNNIIYEQDVFFKKEDFNTSLISTGVNRNKTNLWRAAIKLPMYWVAIIPVMVGNTLAYVDTGILLFTKFTIFIISAICIIAWLNIR